VDLPTVVLLSSCYGTCLMNSPLSNELGVVLDSCLNTLVICGHLPNLSITDLSHFIFTPNPMSLT
jgi:hypothetical protein